ncbi:hypothetical protein [Streptomyces sp. NBC_00356]|uniref:hypothetical protein n=1 Tax=Streptomyces sp. NBC_00356 TaxID=2975724 RepID=UPI002E254012
MNELRDRAELIELMGRYADIADLKEFTELPGLVLADPVTVDFEPVAGIQPTTVPLNDYVEGVCCTLRCDLPHVLGSSAGLCTAGAAGSHSRSPSPSAAMLHSMRNCVQERRQRLLTCSS